MTISRRSTTTLVASLAVTGIAGATLRWGAGAIWHPRGALLAANIVGCALVGWAMLRSAPAKPDMPAGRSLTEGRGETSVWFTVGLCGGITSFSAAIVELAADIDRRQVGTAALWLSAALAAIGTLLRWRATDKTILWSSPATGLAAVNLVGAFLAGLFYEAVGEFAGDLSSAFITVLVVGGIGTLTTVSGLATGYLATLIAGGIAAAWLGIQLTD